MMVMVMVFLWSDGVVDDDNDDDDDDNYYNDDDDDVDDDVDVVCTNGFRARLFLGENNQAVSE